MAQPGISCLILLSLRLFVGQKMAQEQVDEDSNVEVEFKRINRKQREWILTQVNNNKIITVETGDLP